MSSLKDIFLDQDVLDVEGWLVTRSNTFLPEAGKQCKCNEGHDLTSAPTQLEGHSAIRIEAYSRSISAMLERVRVLLAAFKECTVSFGQTKCKGMVPTIIVILLLLIEPMT